MKKFLFPFLLVSAVVSAQPFSVPAYTMSLNHAVNCYIDSTVIKANNAVNERFVYTYDANYKLLTKYRRDYQMNVSQLETFDYDANDSVIKKTHGQGLSAPNFTMMTRMTRNLAKRVEFDTVLYSSGGPYTVNSATSYSYDASGNPAEITRHTYTGTWAPQNKLQYSWNGAGKITNILFQGWLNNAWENSTQSNHTYNSNGDIADSFWQTWNPGSSQWVNQSRDHYAYTGAHVDTFTTYQWNNAWVNGSRYTYTPAGPLDTVTVETWDGAQWDKFTRYARTWSQGLMTSITEQDYISGWQSAWKYDYVYDGQGNHITTNISAYVGGANPWFVLITGDHDYSCYAITVGLAEKSSAQAKVYPVPTNGLLYINSSIPVMSGVVLNLSGQAMVRFEGNSVDLTPLAPGIYFIQLRYTDGSAGLVKAIRN